MKRFPVLGFVALVGLFIVGCAGDPEPSPVTPLPEARTPPVPQEQPRGHAPLVGTQWRLTRLYGDMRRLSPTSRAVFVEFTPAGEMIVQGPENRITGVFVHTVTDSHPSPTPTREAGLLTTEGVVRHRRAGSFSEFEDVLLDNLGLFKGYSIQGETPEGSTLTIWGGFRSEEVVLIELDYQEPF
jgi:hypothetical protein